MLREKTVRTPGNLTPDCASVRMKREVYRRFKPCGTAIVKAAF